MKMSSYAIILVLPLTQVLAQICPSSYSQPNMKLQGHVIKVYSALPTSGQCSVICSLHADCHSVNYFSSPGICEVNNANHLTHPESLVYSVGCRYLDYPLRPVSRCSNKLCSYPLECRLNNDHEPHTCTSCEERYKVFKFPRKTATDYVMYEHPFEQLTALTLGMWVQADTSTTFHVPFSYATNGQHNELTVVVKSTRTEILLHAESRSFPSAFDGQWHHICLTWTNADGRYSMYIDGLLKGQGTMKKGHVIQKGAVVLGQDQDSYKGSFDKIQSLQGNLTRVNLWDKVLKEDEISALANRCFKAEGNVIMWTDLQDKITVGNVKLICSRFCDY